MRNGPIIGAILASCVLASPCFASTNNVTEQQLSGLTIEELAQIEVRSASKRDEPLSEAPTALYVITGEAIEDSAATSLPEALRLAPNLQVQRISADEYAITARGFNGPEASNKLLVRIDGRTVYTPLHSAVFWPLHAPLLEDIAQIEVISGPGGTLYGPNAVNGVVNVVTLDSRDTLGGMVRGTAGANERTAAARYGVPIGDGALRIYGTWYDREQLPGPDSPVTDDHFRGWQAGFRGDFGTDTDHVTVQGDVFDNRIGQFDDDGNSGHNLLARWTRVLGADSSFQLQAYYDRFERRFLLVRDSLQTFDAEAQVNASAGAHDLVVGAGVRTTKDEFINNLNMFKLDPESRRLWVYTLFAQDRVALSERLALIAGIKLERSTFTGWEVLPNVRLAWQPDETTLLWGAVSRAVRTPSRIDRQLEAPPFLEGGDFQSEKLIAFEAGYRGQPSSATSLSVSLFYNLYDDIRSTEFTGDPFPVRLRNGYEGETYGIEAWGGAQLTPRWRVNLGAATIWKDFELEAGRVDLAGGQALGQDPSYQLFARSRVDLSDRLEFDAGLRFIDDIDEQPRVDSYVEADARLGYLLTDSVELYVAGANLLHDSHLESNTGRAQRVERSVYAGTRVRF